MSIGDRLRDEWFAGVLIYELKKNGFGGLVDLPGEFCNDPDEFHALVLGLLSPLERGRPDAEIIATYPPEVQVYVRREWHYFKFGQFVARALIAGVGLYLGIELGIAPAMAAMGGGP